MALPSPGKADFDVRNRTVEARTNSVLRSEVQELQVAGIGNGDQGRSRSMAPDTWVATQEQRAMVPAVRNEARYTGKSWSKREIAGKEA